MVEIARQIITTFFFFFLGYIINIGSNIFRSFIEITLGHFCPGQCKYPGRAHTMNNEVVMSSAHNQVPNTNIYIST